MPYFINKEKRSYSLIKDNEALIEMKYHKWSYAKGDCYVGEKFVSIKPQNVWMRKLDILKNNVDVGDIIFNWKGHIIIQIEDENYKMQEYLMKPNGFWKRNYTVYNSNEKVLFHLHPKFSWKTFGTNFTVEIEEFAFNDKELAFLEELMVYMVFGINLQMAQAGAAA